MKAKVLALLLILSIFETFHLLDGFEIDLEEVSFEPCNIEAICDRNENATEAVTSYCNEKNYHIRNRCCYKKNSVVGIDMSNCNLTTIYGKMDNYPDLVILSLQNNAELNCSSQREFFRLIKLDALILSDECNCPGHWETENLTEYRLCKGQLDECEYQNVTCTDFGMCFPNGPGIASCDCKPGHSGYRCLRQGEFPIIPFSVGISVPTLVLSFFVWFTQRRLVKTE